MHLYLEASCVYAPNTVVGWAIYVLAGGAFEMVQAMPTISRVCGVHYDTTYQRTTTAKQVGHVPNGSL